MAHGRAPSLAGVTINLALTCHAGVDDAIRRHMFELWIELFMFHTHVSYSRSIVCVEGRTPRPRHMGSASARWLVPSPELLCSAVCMFVYRYLWWLRLRQSVRPAPALAHVLLGCRTAVGRSGSGLPGSIRPARPPGRSSGRCTPPVFRPQSRWLAAGRRRSFFCLTGRRPLIGAASPWSLSPPLSALWYRLFSPIIFPLSFPSLHLPLPPPQSSART